jgi:DNA-binding GntR family transcriptional regulator
MLASAPSLTDQLYDALVDAICAGELAPGTHLVQERLAERFGISRQPIQQVMIRLKADGMVEEMGRRGLFVAALDPVRTRDHYAIRAALDGWAARAAACRIASDPALAGPLKTEAQAVLKAGRGAVRSADVAAQVRCDSAFHALLYTASGNPLVATTAEPHWRFLRRAMGAVLRKVEAPAEIWRQHGLILEAVLSGEAPAAERLAVAHAEQAAVRLVRLLEAEVSEAGAP